MIAHGEVSFYWCFNFSRQRLKLGIVQTLCRSFSPFVLSASFACACRLASLVFLLLNANRTRMPRLRNFDTEPHSPYCYEGYSDKRLESVANAHTAADLHVRPVS